MPKAMQYSRGSVIYFEGDKDERIFILQKGTVVLSSIDVETNAQVNEQVKEGEFFGVKSAFGRFPREETAKVLTDTIAVALTVPEFEQLFSGNQAVIMKMLKVFSNQLRNLHKKINSILNKGDDVANLDEALLEVAQSFFNEEQYKTCADICVKYLTRFPTTTKKEALVKLLAESKRQNDLIMKNPRLQAAKQQVTGTASLSAAMKQFSLPAFARFAKTFQPGSVIIAEHEPGDCFYLIQSGRVQLVKTVKGANKNLDILMPSEFFGEMAILENTPRSATCIALDVVQVLEFNKENFQILIMGNPQIALILLKMFCKRIYDQRRQLKVLVIQDVSARIADVFLMLDETQPSEGMKNERSRKFNLTMQDLSHWSGLPQDIVRDEMGKFIEKHRIEVFDGYMVVNNMGELRRLVDSRSQVRPH